MIEENAQYNVRDSLDPPRKERNNKRPRIKYSMICPHFRINPWIIFNFRSDISGIKKRSIGSKTEDVFFAENVSVDIQNMTIIHNITGDQYLKILLKFAFISIPCGVLRCCGNLTVSPPSRLAAKRRELHLAFWSTRKMQLMTCIHAKKPLPIAIWYSMISVGNE